MRRRLGHGTGRYTLEPSLHGGADVDAIIAFHKVVVLPFLWARVAGRARPCVRSSLMGVTAGRGGGLHKMALLALCMRHLGRIQLEAAREGFADFFPRFGIR